MAFGSQPNYDVTAVVDNMAYVLWGAVEAIRQDYIVNRNWETRQALATMDVGKFKMVTLQRLQTKRVVQPPIPTRASRFPYDRRVDYPDSKPTLPVWNSCLVVVIC